MQPRRHLHRLERRLVITRLGTAPRARGLDCAAFQEHWRSGHADVARELPGLRRYVQNHAILRDGRPLLGYPGFDACSEVEFDSLQAMDEAFSSEHYRGAVSADEQSLIDRARFRPALLSRRVLIAGEPAADAVKLMTFWQLDPEASLAQLESCLAGPGRIEATAFGVQRHEQLIQIEGAHEGRTAAACAAVDSLWLADVQAALALLQSAEAHRAAWELASIGRGATRLLAREITVVRVVGHT